MTYNQARDIWENKHRMDRIMRAKIDIRMAEIVRRAESRVDIRNVFVEAMREMFPYG